jgi:hypothetical protein
LAAQPGWAFVRGWADPAFESNTPERLRALAADGRMVLREDMPGWIGAVSGQTRSPRINAARSSRDTGRRFPVQKVPTERTL